MSLFANETPQMLYNSAIISVLTMGMGQIVDIN